MALAFNNNYTSSSRVDVESLLWEMRDILRGLSQINKAQSVEIERLGGNPLSSLVAAEYDERAQAAIEAVDLTLDQLLDTGSFIDDDAAESSMEYNLNIAAWIEATNASLELPTAIAPETLPATASSTPSKDVPNDFWNVQEFKWEDEPEDTNTGLEPSSAPNLDLYSGFEDPEFDEWETSSLDDELSPSDSVTERAFDDDDDDDDDDDEDFEDDDDHSAPHSSSNDDSATLFHPPEDQAAAKRAVERHAFGTGQKTFADVAQKASLLTMEQPFTTSMPLFVPSSIAHIAF